MLSDCILTLEILEEPLTVKDGDLPSIRELKVEIKKQIDEKVLGYKLKKTPGVKLQAHVITDLHKFSYMCIPSEKVMKFDNKFIGSKTETLVMIKNFFGSRDFKNLLKLCDFQEEKSVDSEDMKLMGFSFEAEVSQPSKRIRAENTSVSIFKMGHQQIWSKKWLNYSEHVRKNPLELSPISTIMTQLTYSEQVIIYLNEYRKVDFQFAELAIQVELMLPSSSNSEHLWSLTNRQVKPNMKFRAIADRTLLASNVGFLMNGYC